MIFEVTVSASKSCKAKFIARRKVAEWSAENNTTVYVRSFDTERLSQNTFKVTVYTKGGEGTILLS